jgi:glycolate oxidase FAD binding subunit
MSDLARDIAEQVRVAAEQGTPLIICGGGTKHFLGRITQGETLDVTHHRGIVSYEPTELVATFRAGTPLAEAEAALAEHDQMLAFEPPHFGAGATIGGVVAAGLSGPRRPYAGAVRDFVLGTRLINGKGEDLRFGGQVMKNVAGYDVSRLMAGAMGTLGVLLEVSLKVLPIAPENRTLAFDATAGEAIRRMNAWAGEPLPLSAASHDGELLLVRLSGTPNGIASATTTMGGEAVVDDGLWRSIREHEHPFFGGDESLWRLSVPAGCPPLDLPGRTLVDWGGAQRWLRSTADAARVRGAAAAAGGHATLFRGGDRTRDVLHPLDPGIRRLHERLKAAFDPHAVLNPGRLYQGL